MKEKSVILVPTYRYIEPETESALRELERRGFEVWRRFGFSAVDGARAKLATEAYFAGREWLYWIDSDMHFRVSDFLQLEAHNRSLCCAPYSMKGAGGRIAVKGFVTEKSRGLTEVEAAGFGFMKTHRSIYDAMIKDGLPLCVQDPDGGRKLYPFFQPRWWREADGRDVYYGEDFSFCLHARQLGFQLFADFDIQIGHIGSWSFKIRQPL